MGNLKSIFRAGAIAAGASIALGLGGAEVNPLCFQPFGGFLGIGEDYYPLPWSLLTYNPRLEGYEVNVGEQQLKGAPKYSKHESWDWSDRARDQKVSDYYGVAPFWGS